MTHPTQNANNKPLRTLVDIGDYAAVNESYSGDLDNLSDDGEPDEYLALSRTNPYRS